MTLRERLLQAFRDNAESVLLEQLPGVSDQGSTYTYNQVYQAASRLHMQIQEDRRPDGKPLHVGVVMDNGPTWVAADIALFLDTAVEVPIALGFSAAQADSLLETIDICLVDQRGAQRIREWYGELPPFPVYTIHIDELLGTAPNDSSFDARRPLHDDICKIIHTSGTTSRPKGVMVRESALDVMLSSLLARGIPGSHSRYLCVVPLSVLTEQLAAIYFVIGQGGRIIFLPLGSPLLGAEGVTADALFPQIRAAKASALTLRPSFVEAFLDVYLRATSAQEATRELFGTEQPPFIACGGAPIALSTLERLAGFGVMVYEGYGLSENCTVVSWNNAKEWKLGTVGKPLPHVQLLLADDGELLIKSASLFAGYTRTDPTSCIVDSDGWLHTGDLASIDEDGYLKIIGRKKNIIISSHGYNVSPESVETSYMTLDFVEEAIVLGDGCDALHGVFVVSDRYPKAEAIRRLENFGKLSLCARERVAHITVLPSTKDTYDRFFTVSGKPRRERLVQEFLFR